MRLLLATIAGLPILSTSEAPAQVEFPPTCGMAPWGDGASQRGVGMIGNGWDGEGQNSTTIYFRVENASPFLGPSQRQVFLEALSAWAEVVQIHFVELAFSNSARSIDFLWADGDHCDLEPDECGEDLCGFNGMEFGAIAHGFYPPGIDNLCGGPSTESRAGNVHFDEDESFSTNPNNSGYSLKLTAAHMIGHALGLQDNDLMGDHDVMGPIEWNENFIKISQTDALQIQAGYAAGTGSVTTLESSGIWVNGAWLGPETGMPGCPFDTLQEGVAGLPPHHTGVTIHVLGGLYPGSITISEPCTIMSELGTAFIGQ